MLETLERKPNVSVVVVVYNMPREAPRTLYSLSAGYQRYIDPDDYEVIVVDNGSNPPLDPQVIGGLEGHFRLIRIYPASPSPGQAVNRGLAEARGDVIGVMVDGARIVTPGLVHFAQQGARLYDKAVVATLGWYLGYDFQRWALQCGYDHAREDALLGSIDWPNDGYRLFEIGTMDESSVDGWFQQISESNALFLRRELWDLLGGFDERFDAPGGGPIDLDTFSRILECADARLVILLGEATFHQLHGGTSTNAPPDRQSINWVRWQSQYATIRGRHYEVPRLKHARTYIGTLPQPALSRMVRAAIHPNARHFEQPLGADFNKELWTRTPSARSADPTIAGLVDLAENEFRHGRFEACCAVARLIRERAPDEPGSQRLLSLVASWLPVEGPQQPQRVGYHLALAKAHGMLGENETAELNFRAALTVNPDLPQAHDGLARLRMPGDDYLEWLARLYRLLAPETAIEIGVYEGDSLASLRLPTVAVGIDPIPRVVFSLKAETHLFAETSDDFFARRRPERLLEGRPLSVAFIDGRYVYEQALRDFIHLETYCGPGSVILFHDTVPLDEATQSRACDTRFSTGDVWKTVICLTHYRPDLDIFTIPARPTGLTVVTGLDPTSRTLTDKYDEAVARFIDVPFSAIECRVESALNIISNDWRTVQSRLQERGILIQAANAPVRALASSLDNCLEVGCPIDFSAQGKSLPFTAAGWSAQESDFRWTDGQEAIVRVRLESSPAGHVRDARIVRLRALAFARSQRLIVSVDGNPAAELRVDGTWRDYDIVVDTSHFTAGAEHEITFTLPDAHSPKSAGMSNDSRELGIALSRLTFLASTAGA
jgi:glycosyltransferase involved in cell wall biosynthesis